MALDFPASSASPFTAPNGVIYTWNAAGYWEAKADPNDFDSDYLKLDATNGPVTGDLTLNEDLNVGDDLTVTGTSTLNGSVSAATNLSVAGTSYFTGLTTHAGGAGVSGEPLLVQAMTTGIQIKSILNKNKTTEHVGFLAEASTNVNNIKDNIGFKASSALSFTTTSDAKGFYSNLNTSGTAANSFNFFAAGSAPSYFKGGIQFDLAAIGAGSSQDLNLNAYEKGTWSPRIGATNNNPLEYNVTQLDTPVYERIGNLVYISCRIRIDGIANAGNNTGNLSVFNLPFSVPAERFISTVTCGFTGLSLKVEAGLIQANQMALMVNAVANNYTRQLITATATNRDALAIVQIAGIYKS